MMKRIQLIRYDTFCAHLVTQSSRDLEVFENIVFQEIMWSHFVLLNFDFREYICILCIDVCKISMWGSYIISDSRTSLKSLIMDFLHTKISILKITNDHDENS